MIQILILLIYKYFNSTFSIKLIITQN